MYVTRSWTQRFVRIHFLQTSARRSEDGKRAFYHFFSSFRTQNHKINCRESCLGKLKRHPMQLTSTSQKAKVNKLTPPRVGLRNCSINEPRTCYLSDKRHDHNHHRQQRAEQRTETFPIPRRAHTHDQLEDERATKRLHFKLKRNGRSPTTRGATASQVLRGNPSGRNAGEIDTT